MQQTANDKKGTQTTLWVLAMICMAVVIFALCGGGAYSSVRTARLSAAKASIGQIEAVLLLAEKTAAENGMGAAPTTYDNLLRSYDDSTQIALTDYERYVLKTMLDSFGSAREFDFAIIRSAQGGTVQLQVYYFPVRGKTDMKTDRYYVMTGGAVVENNG